MTKDEDRDLSGRLDEVLEELRAIRAALEGPRADHLLDAREVAELLGVSRAFVYENADRLGAIRLPSPSGDRPRLRFRRTTVLAAFEETDESRPKRSKPEVELLPIRGREG